MTIPSFLFFLATVATCGSAFTYSATSTLSSARNNDTLTAHWKATPALTSEGRSRYPVVTHQHAATPTATTAGGEASPSSMPTTYHCGAACVTARQVQRERERFLSKTSYRSSAVFFKSITSALFGSGADEETVQESSSNLSQQAADNDDAESPTLKRRHSSIYSYPALYDVAFGYRDYEQEVDFLLSLHKRFAVAVNPNVNNMPQRILEVAAGPARHAMTALQQYGDDFQGINSVTCIDNQAAMKTYATDHVLKQVVDEDWRESFYYHVQDMRNIQLDLNEPFAQFEETEKPKTLEEKMFDTAWILLGSLAHLTANNDVIDTLQGLNRVLKPGGTVILELPHPSETFGLVESTTNEWSMPIRAKTNTNNKDNQSTNDNNNNKMAVNVIWGAEDDEFDPITQIKSMTVRVQLSGQAEDLIASGIVDPELVSAAQDQEDGIALEQVVPVRMFTAQELDLFARLTGFEVVAHYGALEEGVAVDDEESAYRLVTVLRKRL